MKEANTPFVALGSRLKGVPEVLTLGVKPNFHDYTRRERQLILNAPIILYPTLNYAQFLTTLGKRIFPSLDTHLYADDPDYEKDHALPYVGHTPSPDEDLLSSASRRHYEGFQFPLCGKTSQGFCSRKRCL